MVSASRGGVLLGKRFGVQGDARTGQAPAPNEDRWAIPW